IGIRKVALVRIRIQAVDRFPPVWQAIVITIPILIPMDFWILFVPSYILFMIGKAGLSAHTSLRCIGAVERFFYHPLILLIQHGLVTSHIRQYILVSILC